MRTVWPLLMVSMTLGGCPNIPAGGTGSSGITGTITEGPTCPITRPGDPECADRPFAGTVLVKTASGLLTVTQFTANADGSFSIPLAPGTYLLDPQPGANGFPHGSPQTVTVNEGAFTQVTIQYDTGIR